MPTVETMSVDEAASRLGCDKLTVMSWLREVDNNGQPTCPFGHAIECQKRFRYLISRARFERYMNGDDLTIRLYHIENSELQAKLEKQYADDRAKYFKIEEDKQNSEYNQLSEKRKLIRYYEESGFYYTIQDIYRFLAPCPDACELCRKGIYKSINPNGHKWFIEKEAFDNLDPEVFPEKCRKRFIKHVQLVRRKKD